jgi:hypothetical protein
MAMSDTLRQFNTGDEVHARLMAEHQESLLSEIRLALTMERKDTSVGLTAEREASVSEVAALASPAIRGALRRCRTY